MVAAFLRVMSRSRFVIAFLTVLVIALIFFPAIGETLRAPVVYAFGETASDIIGGLSGIGGLIGILVWFIRWSAGQRTRGRRHIGARDTDCEQWSDSRR